jgi:hypothetical protein
MFTNQREVARVSWWKVAFAASMRRSRPPLIAAR